MFLFSIHFLLFNFILCQVHSFHRLIFPYIYILFHFTKGVTFLSLCFFNILFSFYFLNICPIFFIRFRLLQYEMLWKWLIISGCSSVCICVFNIFLIYILFSLNLFTAYNSIHIVSCCVSFYSIFSLFLEF